MKVRFNLFSFLHHFSFSIFLLLISRLISSSLPLFCLSNFLLFITLAETYVRQGKYIEAVKSFEKEINIITGDLGLGSNSNSRNSSSSKDVTEARNELMSENRTTSIEIGKEGEEEVGKNSTTGINSGETDTEHRKQTSSLSYPLPPTPSNTTSTSASSTKRSYTEEFHANKKKEFTTIEKNKLKLLHMRLGNIYGNHLLNLQLASNHYEKSLEYGGDMDKAMRVFFAKNARKLDTSKKEIILGVNPGVDDVNRVNVTLSDHISNVLNNSTNRNQTRGSEKGSEKSVGRDQDSLPLGDVKQSKGPKSGPAVLSRKNRWVVRSDVIEGDGAQSAGPGVSAGMGDGTGGGMKMGGMGRVRGGGEESEYADAEGKRQGGGAGAGGAAGASSFESQVRMKEELEEAEEEERRRTGTSAGAGSSTASAVLSSLSNNRRGR